MTLHLRLYLAGEAPNSVAARRTLERVVAALGADDVVVETVDVFEQPRLAIEDGVLVTPTLIRLSPAPRRMVVGNLGDGEAVRALLGAGGSSP